MLTTAEKLAIVEDFGGEKNTGKTEVQVALLTADIKKITEHMKLNKKDNSTKRGLQVKVSKRRSLLTYLKNNDVVAYRELIAKLGLRG